MFTTETQIARNVAILVKAGVAALQAAGWSEARILAVLPYLATEAVAHLAHKAG